MLSTRPQQPFPWRSENPRWTVDPGCPRSAQMRAIRRGQRVGRRGTTAGARRSPANLFGAGLPPPRCVDWRTPWRSVHVDVGSILQNRPWREITSPAHFDPPANTPVPRESGTLRIVLTLSVTSSPTRPSPRVAACVKVHRRVRDRQGQPVNFWFYRVRECRPRPHRESWLRARPRREVRRRQKTLSRLSMGSACWTALEDR